MTQCWLNSDDGRCNWIDLKTWSDAVDEDVKGLGLFLEHGRYGIDSQQTSS